MKTEHVGNIYQEIMLKLFRIAREEGSNSKYLPSLRALAEEFGCTAPTVLRAVRALIERGVLAPLERGGYRTLPQGVSGKFHYIATVSFSGMNLVESHYSIMMKYHAVDGLARNMRDLNFMELQAVTRGDIGRMIRSGTYNGVILLHPTPEIVPEAEVACRAAGIPLGLFGGALSDDGDVSATFDVKNDFLRLFDRLAQRSRRRMLVLSLPGSGWNENVRRAVEEGAGRFDKTVFMAEGIAENTDFLMRNTGGRGDDFDCVVYVMNFADSFSRLRVWAPDCLCSMPEFGAWREKDFRGLVMHYDLDAASRQFGQAMAAVLNKKIPKDPRCFIPCSIQEIS